MNIEALIDKTIDNFHNEIIKNKNNKKYIEEVNFVKYQKDINKIFSDYENNINKKDINTIIDNDKSITLIFELLKKYIVYYTFLYIGSNYKGKDETFINNIIEYSKNQSSYELKINNFFNSESNSNIIKYHNLIKEILYLINIESKKYDLVKKTNKYKKTIDYLESLDENIINLLKNDKNLQKHNIIKTIIINKIYLENDKKNILEIIQSHDINDDKYIFIDVVVPLKEYIDFNSIENVISLDDIENGLAYEIYDLITKSTEKKIDLKYQNEKKILDLINNKILIPISDDFMLYHKDSEKYDDKNKQFKEETKIKYIIDKIEKIVNNNDNNKDNKDNKDNNNNDKYYINLLNRKAITINEYEDQNIIKKLKNLTNLSIENEANLNDLLNYRKYPYINFKKSDKSYLTLNLNKTIPVVRYVSINDKDNNNLQMRVGSNNQLLNIVGFVINDKLSDLYCKKIKNLYNIRDIKFSNNNKISRIKNGSINVLKILKKKLLRNKKFNQLFYWIFDIEKDKLDLTNYMHNKNNTINEELQIMFSQFYDEIILMIYKEIYDKINNSKNIDIYKFKKIIEYYDKKILYFPRNGEMYNKLQILSYYYKNIQVSDTYDKKEDIFFGMYGDVIKLPVYKNNNVNKFSIIDTKKIKEQDDEEETDIIKYNAVCQHLITWEKISALRNKNPNEYTFLLYEFINNYVIENTETDYICKSCGIQINIKNYISSGTFDDGKFISFGTPFDTPLEDLIEYSQLKTTIKYMEKNINRISDVCNMVYFKGNDYNAKQKKKSIIKDSIDILTIHNNNIKEIYQSRKEKINNLYGINKELTNLFSFTLENNIFVYSSKDKDKYKIIKQNNVLIYLLLLMILELSNTHILLMTGDKLCNYYFFDKYGLTLFDNLNIIINNNNDKKPIKNYKTLCYILYYCSCMLTKYNMWNNVNNKTKKYDPVTQKTIIHTLVDLLNSLIEIYLKNVKKNVNNNENKNYLYEIIVIKFFRKLNTLFNNNDIINKIKNIDMKKIVIQDGKRKFIKKNINSIKISPFSFKNYQGIEKLNKCNNKIYYLNKRTPINLNFDVINNISNCVDGKFHNFKLNNSHLQCEYCNKQLNQLEFNTTDTVNAKKNYKLSQLAKKAKKYCISGSKHKFKYDTESNKNICIKCNYYDNKKLDDKSLLTLEKNIITKYNNYIYNNNKKLENKLNKQLEINNNNKKYIDSLKTAFSNTKNYKQDYISFINNFINLLENIIGKNININNQNLYLSFDTYIIDHDHEGFPLKNNIILKNDKNFVKFINNHSFFKKNVLYYKNSTFGNVDIFYDANSLLLLGFKKNQTFHFSTKNNVFLKKNYSILNKLKYMGFTSSNINIQDDIVKLQNIYENDDKQIFNNIILNISRNRLSNLKKLIIDIQRFINNIKFTDKIYDGENISMFNTIINKFYNKLKNIKINDAKNNLFNNWSIINDYLKSTISNLTFDYTIEQKYISGDDIINFDYHGNIVLHYIITQFTQLINLNNNNKFIQSNIVYLIIDIINYAHDLFNNDSITQTYELKRFVSILYSKTFVHDDDNSLINQLYGDNDTIDYENIKKIDDVIENNKEEIDAIDVDGEAEEINDLQTENLDYEIDYASGVNYNTSFSNESSFDTVVENVDLNTIYSS